MMTLASELDKNCIQQMKSKQEIGHGRPFKSTIKFAVKYTMTMFSLSIYTSAFWDTDLQSPLHLANKDVKQTKVSKVTTECLEP